LPLENADHIRKHRDLRWGVLEEDGDLYSSYLAASGLVKQVANDEVEDLRRPIQYIGVDVQFFSALLSPLDKRPLNQRIKSPWFEFSMPDLVFEDVVTANSDISVKLQANVINLPANSTAEPHRFAMFAGPKRKELLAAKPFGAEDTMNLGWFSAISNGMLAVLKFLHDTISIPYGFAIICLTIMVRAAMFPLSRKQALSAQKMKEFQPKLTELRAKHGKDKEKMAKAQMELFQKHGYNPLAGCLPMIIQMPIFFGLYRMLNSAVDLRRAPFLWFDNLAAPDQLFQMPFSIPFLGSDFNLLPILTVVLFYAQQKMFMPPATTPEMEQQQKMMSFMMIFMGFLFYHMPAGLCVYFIASSGWGLIERKLLGKWNETHPTTVEKDDKPDSKPAAPTKRSNGNSNDTEPDGLMQRLLAKADAAGNPAAGSEAASRPSGKSRKKKKKR